MNLAFKIVWNCDESGLPHKPKKKQNVVSKGAKNYSGISFFQKHLYYMIKITESNKGTLSCVFSIILRENHIYQSFQKFEEVFL